MITCQEIGPTAKPELQTRLAATEHSAECEGRPADELPADVRQAVTHGTGVSVTIAAKIAATTPSTARGTMPIQYAGIGSSR